MHAFNVCLTGTGTSQLLVWGAIKGRGYSYNRVLREFNRGQWGAISFINFTCTALIEIHGPIVGSRDTEVESGDEDTRCS